MRQKTLMISIIAAVVIFSIALITIQDEKFGLYAKKEPIKIGITVWSGDAHAFLALDKGFFEKNNVQVELYFKDEYSEIEKKYMDGELDGVFATLTDAINYNYLGVKSKVVYTTDYSNDADVIVGSGTSLSDMRGKTLGVEDLDGYSHIFAIRALEQVGLNEDDVDFAIVPAQDILIALDSGQIDAGHTYEPTKSDALRLGYNVLFSGGQIPGTITSTLVFNSDLIKERPDDVLAVVKSLVEAQEYRDSKWGESMHIMANAQGLTVSDMESGFDGMNTLDLNENLHAFTQSNSTESLYGSGKFIMDYYLKRGKTDMPMIDEIIEPQFVKKLAE
jgi:NitT/TauT family transport system substrate-binding protein